jgi:hypothetical protein
VDGTTLACVIDNIHSERATVNASYITWSLGGECLYLGARFHASGTSANATLYLNGLNATYENFRVEDNIVVEWISTGATMTLVTPNIAGTLKNVTNQTGSLQIFGGTVAILTADPYGLRAVGTAIGSLTIGVGSNPLDPTLARFENCDITTLVTGTSLLAAATFVNCKIGEGNNLLKGWTVLLGCVVTFAGTCTVQAPLYAKGTTFKGNLDTNGAAVFDDGCVCTGTVTGSVAPTTGTWNQGQVTIDLTGATQGATCTVAGTPGTWITTGGALAHTLTIGAHLTGGSFNGSANVTIATDAVSTNTASTIVARDGAGNFSAGTITANLTGGTVSGSTGTFSDVVSALSYQLSAVGGALAGSVRFIDGGGTAGSWNYNVTTGSTHAFSVNGVLIGQINATEITGASFQLSSVGGLLSPALRFIDGGGTAGSWEYNVPTGSVHAFAVNGVNQALIGVGGITANLTGNATTATTATTANGLSSTLTFGTHITGTSFNGSSNVTIATDAVSTNTASTIVARDGSGNFSAGTITASLTGNCSGSSGSCTGNAATVTTNANLTGNVTSVGNVTTIAAGVVTNAMLAGSIDLTAKVTGQLPFANGGSAGSATTSATTGTMTVNMTTSIITITPSGSCTFNASGGLTGQRSTFIITTSGGTSRTLTWNTNYKTTSTLATGTVTGKTFTVSFVCLDGTNWYEEARTIAM